MPATTHPASGTTAPPSVNGSIAPSPGRSFYPSRMQERLLAEKLIGYDSSTPEGVRLCAGFVKGWFEARDIPTRQLTVRDLPIVIAEVGPPEAQRVIFHGHIDVVPGRAGQFDPIVDGDRLIGRGAYDMKGAARR